MSPMPSCPRRGQSSHQEAPPQGTPTPTPLARRHQAPGCTEGSIRTALLHRGTDEVTPSPPENPRHSLTRQYSSMGFSLLTATSRMWLLRKRILPGREMLVSQVSPGKAATGTWDPYRLGPLSLGYHLCSLSRQQGNSHLFQGAGGAQI